MAPGDIISHYRVVSRLGQGGMGQVWLAEDTLLERRVALKIIWPHLALDPEGMRRFTQEAKVVASLNHPSIAQIHEIGEAGPVRFLAMEFVDGAPLSDRIEGQPLPLADILEIGIQLAEALEEAHAKGVIHRDIKPGNIMLAERGRVKVLDFGLAKIRRSGEPAGPAGSTQTITGPGEVVGTLRYMSPEQALGREVDHRTDIFSLGAVLYEMATGKQAFPGANPSSVYREVIHRDPLPASQVNRSLHPQVDQVIRRAMEKDRELRYQTASDLGADLKRIKRDIETRRPARLPRRKLLWSAIGVLALLAAAAVWKLLPGRPNPRFAPEPEAKPLTSYPGSESQPSFSPDGNQVAFAWNNGSEDNWDVYVKVVDAGTPLRLTSNPATDYSPAWSPDGRYIAFLRQADGPECGFYLVPALGGLERRIAPASPHRVGVDAPYLTWAPDGKSLALVDEFAPGEPMSIVWMELDSGKRRRLTSPPPKTYGDSSPAFSPDGKHIAFVRTGSLGVQDIYVVPAAGGEPRRLTFDNRRIYGLAWNPSDGTILFSSSRAGGSRLWRMKLDGTPERIYGAGESASFLAISHDGRRLAYTRGIIDTNIWRYEIPGRGRGEPPRSLITSTRHEQGPQYSPDGQHIAFASTRSGAWEIWWCDREGRSPAQLTSFGGPTAGSPYWSPDGQQIVFDARPGGNPDIYVIGINGGAPRRLTDDLSEEIVPSWSRDGKWIYFASNRTFAYEIWKIPAGGGPAVQVTRKGGFHGIESPDGKYLYYAKSPSLPGLWRVPVNGGEETPVIDSFRAGFWGYWAVAQDGIYYLEREELEGKGIQYHLNFRGFTGGRDRRVLTFEKRPFNSGLAISPDGRECLYTQVDHSDTDIMLVDNFR